MKINKIFTHDYAMQIVDLFEDVLYKYDVAVPSSEDSEKVGVGLCQSTYEELSDNVERVLADVLYKYNPSRDRIVTGRCQGTRGPLK